MQTVAETKKWTDAALEALPRDGQKYELRQGDQLEGEDLLPGFRIPVADLFTSPVMDSHGS